MKATSRKNDKNAQTGVPTSGPSVTSFFKENEAELLYVEQYVPKEGDNIHIYWSGCNFYFGPRGGYAGIQHQANKLIDGQIFTYNNICSIWDLATDPAEAEVHLDYGIKGLYSGHFGGEGTGLHTSHPMPWSLNQWYALVIRRWYVPGENVTRMAMFMYSYSDEEWTHYMSASIPGQDIPISGTTCSGFLERFSGTALGYHGVYGQHFRMDKDGNWQKPLYYEASAGGNPRTWHARLTEGNVNIRLIAGGDFDNFESTIHLEPNQFDEKPKVVKISTVDSLSATYYPNDGTVKVVWEVPIETPPQLSYQIEIRAEAWGPVISQNSNTLPQQRDTRFQTGMLAPGSYFATIIITNIFNLQSPPRSVSFRVT